VNLHLFIVQSPGNLTLQSVPREWVKIATPITGQTVAGQNLEVGGESSDSKPDIASKSSNDNELLVSIFPHKNPVARGDNQNIIITVRDSNSRVVPGALINGKLIYPGGNYEKDFSSGDVIFLKEQSTTLSFYAWIITGLTHTDLTGTKVGLSAR
jgi:hypothetical protein